MITFSNGHVVKYFVGSGALAYDGRGWFLERPLVRLGIINPSVFTVTIKTLTRQRRPGNFRWYKPLSCVSIRWTYVANAIALKNPGIEWWCKKIGPKVNRSKIALVASIYSESIFELVEMVKMLNPFDLVGVELNLSCPSVRKMPDAGFIIAACREVKKVSRHPLLVKISVVQKPEQFLKELEKIGVEAISINSVPWDAIFPTKKSPLARYGGGGVSGKAVQPFTWFFAKRLSTLAKIPVIVPSVWERDDPEIIRTRFGAQAVSFASVFMLRPWKPNKIVEYDLKRGNN